MGTTLLKGVLKSERGRSRPSIEADMIQRSKESFLGSLLAHNRKDSLSISTNITALVMTEFRIPCSKDLYSKERGESSASVRGWPCVETEGDP